MKKSFYISLLVILAIVSGCTRHPLKPDDGSRVTFSSSPSSSTVSAIQRDDNGYLWIGTDRGINVYDGTNYRQMVHDRLDSASIRSNNVLDIYQATESDMWVMTDRGIDRYAGNGRFMHYNSDATSQKASSMIETRDGKIIALFGNELSLLEGQTFKKKVRIESPSGGFATNIYEDHNGRLLVNIDNGLFLVDKNLTKATHFLAAEHYTVCADANTICCLTFNHGLVYLRRSDFSILYRSEKSMPVVANSATFWHGMVIFSGNDGFYYIDNRSHTVLPMPTAIQKDSQHKFIQRMYTDPEGNLWIGYIMHGLRHFKSLASWEKELKNDAAFKNVKGKAVTGVVSDGKGNVWGALSSDSIFHIDGHTDSVTALPLNSLVPIHSQQHIRKVAFSAGFFWLVTTSNVFAMHYDKGIKVDEFYDVGLFQNSLCDLSAATSSGLAVTTMSNKLLLFDAIHRNSGVSDIRMAPNNLPAVWQKGDFTVTTKFLGGITSLQFSTITSIGSNRLLARNASGGWKIIDTKTGKINSSSIQLKADILSSSSNANHTFLGTEEGLFVYEPNIDQLTEIKLFSGNAINNIVASPTGVTMTIGGDIVAYDAATHRSHVVWKGIDSNDFQPLTLAKLPHNRVLAATRKGLQLLDTKTPSSRDVRPQLRFEALEVLMPHNKVKNIRLFDADSASTIILSHRQNNFNIRFAAVSPDLSDDYIYRYQLQGYDQQWIESDGSCEASYNEIGSGTYRLIVRCVDRNHPWISRTSSIAIHVLPHPLLSATAFGIYALLIILVLYAANRMYIRMRIVRINADASEKERAHERHVNKMNMDFFANISQEFRNPLTMITGPLSMLSKAPELSKQSANLVRLITQSTSIMRKLIGQMLDFRELEGDAMRLSVSQIDVAAIISDYGHHYELTAVEKDIHIIFRGTDHPMVMLADEDKIIKVFDNLMTNAIRHTPQEGTITVSLSEEDGNMVLCVENSGSHLPEDKLEKIFENYYRLDETVAEWGSGLGLHYVKSLVALHHGQIKATNTDAGICFTVSLPMNEAAYSENEKRPRNVNNKSLAIDNFAHTGEIQRAKHHEDETLTANDTRPKMLIIEKDLNTAYFLRHLFEKDYIVFNRYEGEKAIAAYDEINPDIILSCVMLDDLSGLELCRTLREDKQYHKPFIFLTTCDTGEQQAAGMRAGADAYITKPFDPSYLQEVVKSALGHAQSYDNLLRQLPQKQKKSDDGLSTRDREILRITRKCMKENISDSEIDVAKLGRKLLLSRTKLYEKIKELTGKTPNELFRMYKLNYAASLLKEGKLNVTEVASQTGFSSVAFFSRSFKKYYGVSPKDYS